MTMRTFWVLFLALPLLAEFRQVEIKVSGLECASCAESLPKTLERMRGVESASMDAKAGLVLVKLKAGNKLPFEDLRDKLKQAGYTPGVNVVVGGLNWSQAGVERVLKGEMIVTHGGHFLVGAWAMVVLRDHHDGRDFAEEEVRLQFPMGAFDLPVARRFSEIARSIGAR